MKKVYEDASLVLVLDHDLRTVKEPTLAAELAVRVFLIAWWGRLWTLQEGGLSKELRFCFGGHAVSIRELFMSDHIVMMDRKPPTDPWRAKVVASVAAFYGPKTKMWSASFHITYEALEPVKQLRLIRTYVREGHGHQVFDELGWRSTSVPEDEWICLGTLPGLDVKRLAEAALPDRQKLFIEMQQYFPPSVAIWPQNTKRMSEPRYQWAPRSFLRQPSPRLAFAWRTADEVEGGKGGGRELW